MKEEKLPVNWINLVVLTATPLAALILIPWYGFTVGFDLFEWSVFAFFMMATGLSITAGYHRLWSHKTYQTVAPIRLFWALFGAASLQNSILHWSSDHRRHHRFEDDNDKDPYSIGRGFWFAHIKWILFEYPSGRDDFSNIKDLQRDPIVRWQHRYYVPLAIFMNVALPLGIGYMHGKLWGTLLLAGLLRIVLNHHFTFFINSLAHMFGDRPYSRSITARDNSFLALLTYGEGYHNFHHRFQSDYRNGVKWWHYDPSKWIISVSERMGLASNVKRASRWKIEKAKLQTQWQVAAEQLQSQGNQTRLETLKDSYQECLQLLEQWYRTKQDLLAKKFEDGDKLNELKSKVNNLKTKFEEARERWRRELELSLQPALLAAG